RAVTLTASTGGNRVGKSEYLNYVNGAWVPSHTEATYTVINPATGGKIAAVPQADVEDTRAAIDAARAAFDKGKWPRMTPGDRSAALFKLANLIEADMDHLAPIEVQNQGKTIKQARDADIPFSVDNLRFMAGAARTLTGLASTEYAYGATSVIRREPAKSNVKNLHLELGGKAPFIVFDDANIAAAAEGAVAASMVNGGQDCTQAARFIVHEKAYKKFEDKFLERLKTVRMGDPLMRATDLGPLVSQKQRE